MAWLAHVQLSESQREITAEMRFDDISSEEVDIRITQTAIFVQRKVPEYSHIEEFFEDNRDADRPLKVVFLTHRIDPQTVQVKLEHHHLVLKMHKLQYHNKLAQFDLITGANLMSSSTLNSIN